MVQDLRGAVKGGVDPNGLGSSMVAADVLWSDPRGRAWPALPTLREGVGLIFGPDITQVSMSLPDPALNRCMVSLGKSISHAHGKIAVHATAVVHALRS